jgi:hypothetical protein
MAEEDPGSAAVVVDRTTGMSRCMISIPRPRPVGGPEGVRNAPWSATSIQTLRGSVQKVNSTVPSTVAGV